MKTEKLVGVLEMIHGKKSESVVVSEPREEILKQIDELKGEGWSSSTFYDLKGNIDVKLNGKNYGVKATITGLLTCKTFGK
tara:strand:- start:2208 stop:2450 length:243 start_codon:yes stop_codon:yes gene_type:complete